MSLLAVEGFDHLTSGLLANRNDYYKNSADLTVTTGIRSPRMMYWARTSGGTADDASFLIPGAGSNATWIWGGYVNINPGGTGANACAVVAFSESPTHCHVYLYYDGDVNGTFSLRHNNGTVLCQTSGHAPIGDGDSAYVEVKVTINDSTGSGSIRINGVEYASFSGSDSRNGGTGFPTYLRYGETLGNQSSCGIGVDDVYLCDGAGGSPWNDFLGDCRVETLRPSGAGNSTDFTPSAGSNYENVDEDTSDSDTTYNASDTPGDKDTFALDNLSATVDAVFGVKVSAHWRKDGPGGHTAKAVVRSGGSDYEGSAELVFDSYNYGVGDVRQVDPATGVAWTDTGVNALEAGYKVES